MPRPLQYRYLNLLFSIISGLEYTVFGACGSVLRHYQLVVEV